MEMIVSIASVQEVWSKKTQTMYYRCYIALPDGSMGSVFTSQFYKAGDDAILTLGLNRDGSIGVRFSEHR